MIEQLQQANEEYQESENSFQTLADNIPNLAWMANAEGWSSGITNNGMNILVLHSRKCKDGAGKKYITQTMLIL